MTIKTLDSGFSLPALGLGTWTMGGKREVDHSRDAEWVAAIQGAIGLGYTHIDTAEVYGVGHAEELVAEAIRGMDRAALTIATKVPDVHLAHDDVLNSARASLARLGTEYADLYYIHAPNPDIPLKETMQAFDELMAEGLIRAIGVSNFTVLLLEEAQSYTKNKIVANQIEYNLATRETSSVAGNTKMESEMLPYCQANDVLLVAFKPVDRGTLLTPNPLMDEMAAKYGKSYAQVAISWLISQKNVVAIPKSDKLEHLKENLGATGWQMEEADIERLRREYPATA